MSSPNAMSGYGNTDAIVLAMEQLEMSGLIKPDVTQPKKYPIITSKSIVSMDRPQKARVYSKDELLSLRTHGVDRPKQLEGFTPELMPITENILKEEPTVEFESLGSQLSLKPMTTGVHKAEEEPKDLLTQSKSKNTVKLQPKEPTDEANTDQVGEISSLRNPVDELAPIVVQPSKVLHFEDGDGPDSDIEDEVKVKSKLGDEIKVNPELDDEVKANSNPNVEQPEKKKKKKSKSKSKAKKPTGFEEYYTDPPITPQDYKEETQDLYNSSRSFNERIELCIQRYRQKRNLDEVRALVYTKYLSLGGIDTGAKVGTGALSKADYEEADASQIAAYNATDKISTIQNSKYYNPVDEKDWVVDFTGIVKGFLSYRAPLLFRSSEPDEIKNWTMVVRNFLNYVLLHNVCPEYNEDIAQARHICNIADEEHPRICLISPSLPGDFNQACSTIYGGYYKGLTTTYVDPIAIDSTPYMTDAEAQRIVMTAFAMMGSQELYTKVMAGNPKHVKSGFRSMEVIEVIPATEETISTYKAVKDSHGETGKLHSLGKLKLRHWENPFALDEDLTEAEIANPGAVERHPDTEIWLEDFILEACFVGMKIEAIFHELDIGLTYFDAVTNLHPSFYTYLDNERMNYWKEPKLNERPPPMVGEDFDIDDAAEEKDFE